MRDEIDQARRAGYTDEQILSVIGEDPSQKAEIEGALRGGYSASQVLTVFQDEAGQSRRDAIKSQSWGDYAADLGRGVVYGAGAEAKAVGTALSKPADATGAPSTVNQAGDALQGAGALAQAQATGYRPSQFDIMHPIDTASELPKAAAEAAPGLAVTIGAGAAAGALGGAVGGPLGAGAGAIGGAAAYAFARYWGQNAQAHAENQGRSKPTQADFDATKNESIAMASVDAATLKGGGLIGKSARAGLATKALEAGRTAGAMARGGAINSVIGQTAAMDETRPGQDSIVGRLGNVDYEEAANAGATGAALGGMVRAVRLPAEAVAAVKYRAGGPINESALGRVSDFLNSDAFPADPSNRSTTGQTLRMARDHYASTTAEFAKNADDLGLSTTAKSTLNEASRFLRQGAVYSEQQLARLSEKIGDDTVFGALADQNAVNKITQWSGTGEGQSLMRRTLGAAMRNPGQAGALGGALTEGLPLLMGGLNLATGGKLAASALAAKTLAKVSGFDRVMNDPLASVAERYGSKAPNDPTAVSPTGARTMHDFRALNEARNAFNSPETAPPVAPDAPTPAPAAQPSLADALGIQPQPRFTPRPGEGPAPTAPEAASPFGRPAMSTPDILAQMQAQAEGEGRPLLEVAQEHHRSARSMETNTRLPEPLRLAAQEQAKAIHESIIAPMEAEFGGKADPAVSRARSFKQVEAAPAPDFMISEAGQAMLVADAPAVVQAVAKASSEGAARRTIEAFIGKFGPRDRDFVRQALRRAPEVQRAVQVTKLKASAKTTKVLKRARKPKSKAK